MDRRLALKQLAWVTGGVFLIPGCDFSRENILAAYDKLQVSEDHRNLLGKVVETILPGGEITGARELNIQDFLLVMANDCLDEESRERFVMGLKGFDAYVKEKFGSRFETMDQQKAEKVFTETVNTESDDLADFRHFLNTSKRFALQGYLSSEYYMTEVMPYNMIPGGFQGEKRIDPLEKINING